MLTSWSKMYLVFQKRVSLQQIDPGYCYTQTHLLVSLKALTTGYIRSRRGSCFKLGKDKVQMFTKVLYDQSWEVAQWLRALTALAEDQWSVPSTHVAAHNHP